MSDARPEDAAETVERQAARWFARQRSGEMSQAQAGEMRAWLQADEAHRAAYDGVAVAWAGMGLMRSAPEVLTLRARHRRRFPQARRLLASRAMAACLAVAVLAGGGGLAVQTRLIDFQRLPTQTYQTAVGEQRTLTLRDGSVVTLNTDTVLRTKGLRNQRLLYLDKGQAYFQVAKDPSRPFVVHAAGRTVTAVGTAFDVRVDKGRFEVVLVEGKVKVDTPITPLPAQDAAQAAAGPLRMQTSELVAGSQFVAVSDRGWSVDKTDVARETTWVTGWLKFDSEPLGQIVEELGRYSARRIVLDDPALADVPVSGRFKPEDIDAFVRALETYKIATVTVNSPLEIRLGSMEEKNLRQVYGGSPRNPLLK